MTRTTIGSGKTTAVIMSGSGSMNEASLSFRKKKRDQVPGPVFCCCRKQKGQVEMKKGAFVVSELVIVVAILGILAVVAMPTFINYFKKAKTTEATDGLSKIREADRTSLEPDANETIVKTDEEGAKSVPLDNVVSPAAGTMGDQGADGQPEEDGVAGNATESRDEGAAIDSSGGAVPESVREEEPGPVPEINETEGGQGMTDSRDETREEIRDEIKDEIGDEIREEIRDEAKDEIRDAVSGQREGARIETPERGGR
jgi:Tfp pilus assembly major pilin PilA